MNKLVYSLTNGIIKLHLRSILKVDTSQLDKIPLKGPYILVANHINNYDGPLIYLFLRPRKTIAMGKAELWNNPFTRFIMNLWGVIPIKRGAIDMKGMKMCFDVLKEKNFLCLAPEGTRSKTGILKRGKPGVILFALRQNVPIIPIAHYGLEDVSKNSKRFKRTPVGIKVGDPYVIATENPKTLSSEDKQEIADQVMISIAKLLPEKYHGYYKQRVEDELSYLKIQKS